MSKLIVVTPTGVTREVEAEVGRSVMEVIRENGFDELLALCGGCCSCATCHIYVDEAFSGYVATPSEAESELLESSMHRKQSSRLSCQIYWADKLDGMKVTIALEG